MKFYNYINEGKNENMIKLPNFTPSNLIQLKVLHYD